jgi:hypothetical protein
MGRPRSFRPIFRMISANRGVEGVSGTRHAVSGCGDEGGVEACSLGKGLRAAFLGEGGP